MGTQLLQGSQHGHRTAWTDHWRSVLLSTGETDQPEETSTEKEYYSKYFNAFLRSTAQGKGYCRNRIKMTSPEGP